MKNILISILVVFLVSCTTSPKQDAVSKATNKPPLKNSDYILGAWSCVDRFKVGELDMRFTYNEVYTRDGSYKLEGILTAYFRVENLTREYLLRSHGVWYFSGKKQINYKIEHYSVKNRLKTISDETLSFISLIPKSKSYNALLVNLNETQLRSQIYPFTMGETVCER